jgi:hypothetical protein
MSVKAVSHLALLAIAILGCHSSKRGLAPGGGASRETVDESPKEAILSVLRQGGRSAIVEVRGRCLDARAIAYTLRVNRSRSQEGGTLAELHSLLNGNQGLNFVVDGTNLIVISNEGMDRDLLHVRISHLRLSETEQYNPNDAILAALGSKEIQGYINQHNISLASQWGGLRAVPSPEMPHLAPGFDDLTLEQFEKKILETFPGLIVYQECFTPDGRKLVSFDADRIPVK